jgi:hypothetical protein
MFRSTAGRQSFRLNARYLTSPVAFHVRLLWIHLTADVITLNPSVSIIAVVHADRVETVSQNGRHKQAYCLSKKAVPQHAMVALGGEEV